MMNVSRGPRSLVMELEAYKTSARQRVIEVHTQHRRRYVTEMPGQERLYGRKEAEGLRYLEMLPASIDQATFPLIYHDAAYTNRAPALIAQEYVDRAHQTDAFMGPLEGIRAKASAAIAAATNTAEVDLAIQTFEQDMSARAAT